MINVGIIGADNPPAGELIRILINHPDVNLSLLYSHKHRGKQVNEIHHGFIGEKIINFTDIIEISDLDLLFITEWNELTQDLLEKTKDSDNIKIIILKGDPSSQLHGNFEYGLSEINRKALVRGARKAIIPSPIASLALISLFPLASYLMIPDQIDVKLDAPAWLLENFNVENLKKEIIENLKLHQSSINSTINFEINKNDSIRSLRVISTIKNSMETEEIRKLFESKYDDHNFTFLSPRDVERKEVEGTQKCVIYLTKNSPESLSINIIGDSLMRGGPGEAVHVMNLLFSLHEKIGLQLKSSAF